MTELGLKIIARLEDGWTCTEIAKDMNLPLIWVEDLMMERYYDAEEYYDAE